MRDEATKDEIRQRTDLFELCQTLGLDPKGKVARCPAHHDQGRPNLAIYADHVHCFACGWGGDAFDLVAKVKRLDFTGAFDFLATRLGLPRSEDQRKQKFQQGRSLASTAGTTDVQTTPLPLPITPSPTLAPPNALAAPDAADLQPATPQWSLRVDVFAALLAGGVKASTTPAGDWLQREKGILPATQDRLGLVFLADAQAAARALGDHFGVEPLRQLGIVVDRKDIQTKASRLYFNFARHRLLFPFFWKGKPVDVQGRDIAAKDKGDRFRNTGGRNAIPYNADALLEARTTGEPVFLCEGATDTLTLVQSGRLAVGIVGVGGFKTAWLEAFAGLEIYLTFDSDDAGRTAAKKVTRAFVDGGLHAPKTIRLPPDSKDVTEYFRKMSKP
jgi:DNA primase